MQTEALQHTVTGNTLLQRSLRSFFAILPVRNVSFTAQCLALYAQGITQDRLGIPPDCHRVGSQRLLQILPGFGR